MRRWIVTAALGLAALGLVTLTAGRADAHGPRFFVGVYSPPVVVASPPVVVAAYPVYSYPAPVVVTPAPVVVAPAPVVVTPAVGAVVRVHPRRVFVRFR